MRLDKFELSNKLHQDLIAVDNLIAEYGVAEDDNLTRVYIDQRRQLFAEYEQTLVGVISTDAKSNFNLYRPESELNEFIDLWCGQIRNVEFRPIYLSDPEYCQRFVDCYLPKSWNWETDFVLLINPFDEKILIELARRGQKNLIILRTKSSVLFDENITSKFEEFWEIKELKELENALLFYPRKVSNICHLDCLGKSERDIDSEKINKIVKEGIYVRQINMNTIGKHSLKWANNTIKNIPHFLKYKNISSVSLVNSKMGVIVSPGPSLEKNVHLLKKYADKIFIICPIRSVPILRANDVEPDFVLQLDAIGNEFVDKSRDIIGAPLKNLVLDATVNTGFFNFPAEKKFWYFADSKTLGLEAYTDVGKSGLEAISVSIACLKFGYKFGLTKLILVGQDLAFSKGKQYSTGGDLGFMPGEAGQTTDILVDGYYGGKVGTSPDYDLFIDQFAELGHHIRDDGIELYNCTEGGAYINNFQHLPLAKVLGGIDFNGPKITLEKPDVPRDSKNLIKFCKKSKDQINLVETLGRRALEIEKKNDLNNDDVKNRDKYLRKMVRESDKSKILWWAFQDVLMNSQQITYRKENVTDLKSFLEEIIEICSFLKEGINETEATLLRLV